MEEYVKQIIANGYTYETEDTIYFDTSKLDKYGVLSNKDVDDYLLEKQFEKENILNIEDVDEDFK